MGHYTKNVLWFYLKKKMKILIDILNIIYDIK